MIYGHCRWIIPTPSSPFFFSNSQKGGGNCQRTFSKNSHGCSCQNGFITFSIRLPCNKSFFFLQKLFGHKAAVGLIDHLFTSKSALYSRLKVVRPPPTNCHTNHFYETIDRQFSSSKKNFHSNQNKTNALPHFQQQIEMIRQQKNWPN